MSRQCLAIWLALLAPAALAQAQINRYKQLADEPANAAQANYISARAPAPLPAGVARYAGPIQQVGFHHGVSGGCSSCGGGGGGCGGGYGFVGECCDSIPRCARGVWDSYCGSKGCGHARGCGGGCGSGCGGGCGGGCFMAARGAPAYSSGCNGTFSRSRFRGAVMADCGCEPSCGCSGESQSATPAMDMGPTPAPASASTFGNVGERAAIRMQNFRSQLPFAPGVTR